MSKREKCVYCGKVIVTRSKEHIIQNAIGGLYESETLYGDKYFKEACGSSNTKRVIKEEYVRCNF